MAISPRLATSNLRISDITPLNLESGVPWGAKTAPETTIVAQGYHSPADCSIDPNRGECRDLKNGFDGKRNVCWTGYRSCCGLK